MQIENVYIFIKAVKVSGDQRMEITVRKITETQSSLVYRWHPGKVR